MSRHIPEHPKKGSAAAYEWAERMRQARQKKARTKARVREAGQLTEMQFFGPGGSLEVKPKRNPGARYHEEAARVAGRFRKDAASNAERVMYAGMEIAHKDSAKAAKAMKMNPRKKREAFIENLIRQCAWCKKPMGETIPYSDKAVTHGICAPCLKKELQHAKTFKKNPIAVYNPPAPKVVGTIYNKAIEIRAKKTGSDLAGKYKHVFGKNVKILGLDNGDVVIHHTGGKRLWISRKDYERTGGEHE